MQVLNLLKCTFKFLYNSNFEVQIYLQRNDGSQKGNSRQDEFQKLSPGLEF